jgi:RNA polymerase sigma-70 factor (ECF subfamily)
MSVMTDADVFQADRRLLFSIAYRMLGSASDAEDVVQDAWVRYQGADRGAVRSPRAFATTIVTRLCLDRLKSARAAREEYVGPWLPEPVLTSGEEGPDMRAQRSESVTLAFLVLLETLSPEERAVFLLKEVFDYDHADIAEILGVSTANSRQLFHRAKRRLAEGRPRFGGTRESRREVASRFAAAFQAGDVNALTGLLTEDVGLWSDGGGKVSAARRPLAGRDEVINFLVGLRRVAATTGWDRQATLAIAEVNREPALIVRVAERLDSVYVVSVENDAVAGIRVVRNPDKLGYIERQLEPHVTSESGPPSA